jgi:hypothetical protein
MTEMSTDWIEGLVKPLLVKPGSTVRLAKDFDPGYTGGVRKKDEGRSAPGSRTGPGQDEARPAKLTGAHGPVLAARCSRPGAHGPVHSAHGPVRSAHCPVLAARG